MIFLDDYLEEAFGQPWAWGKMDCCMFAGDWVAQATSSDPMSEYRGIYQSALQARRLIMQRGGLIAMTDRQMQKCGFERVGYAVHGDIAAVRMPAHGNSVDGVAGISLMILAGVWWAGRSIDGMVFQKADPVAAWRVLPC